jgi:hypothetical protein
LSGGTATTPGWKKILPYLVTLLIFALIFSRIPIGRVGAALENVPIVRFFCVFLPFSVVYWLVDSFCLTWVIRRFHAPPDCAHHADPRQRACWR